MGISIQYPLLGLYNNPSQTRSRRPVVKLIRPLDLPWTRYRVGRGAPQPRNHFDCVPTTPSTALCNIYIGSPGRAPSNAVSYTRMQGVDLDIPPWVLTRHCDHPLSVQLRAFGISAEAPRWCCWVWQVLCETNLVDFRQVRIKCAEPEMTCMVVSRFIYFAIQNEFSENDCAHQKPLSRATDPSGVGGYMRKRVVLQ